MPKGRPRFQAGGKPFTPAETKGFEERVIIAAREVMVDNELDMAEKGVPVKCAILFYVPMPPSWSERKRVKWERMPHLQKPDLDNFVKAILDGCEGEVFHNDSQVFNLFVTKRWAPRNSPGYSEITFEWGEYLG